MEGNPACATTRASDLATELRNEQLQRAVLPQMIYTPEKHRHFLLRWPLTVF